jgi:type VI secretion system secreted protein VgrG
MPRVFELGTPLGEDVLLFRAMTGVETLGRLSEFALSALSERPDISSADLLGKNITVAMERRNGEMRYFNGYVTRFAPEGMLGRYFQYRFTARPWLWYLTRTADCRIYQDKTIPEILTEVFTKPEHEGIAAFDAADLIGSYARREYCVQYRETDFNFVSRLMEEEGIYYYFEHYNGRHVMKLVDSRSGHRALEHRATIAYYPPGTTGRVNEEFINAWTSTQSIKPGAVALDDYDFTKPKADLGVKAKLIEPHVNADYEVFDYPGEYSESNDGEHYVRARVDELHTDFDRAEAGCNVREIAVGWLFNLTNAPRPEQEREYLITGARYELVDNAYESGSNEATSYYCSFTALWSQQQFRPERLTQVPRVGGPQTAVVVGPPNEEIWCDKYGRIKVQFHWDRYGKRDENSSWWIRVAHPWAGAKWGAIYLPRIGQEVLVDFLDGDPDRPIIIGSVYNADEMPPYNLPEWKTMSTYKSHSTPHGDPKHYNELRFEDKYGKEQVFIHCQKRMDVRVKQNKYETIGGSCNTGIGGEYALSVYGNHDLWVKGDVYFRADGKIDASTGGPVNVKVGAASKHYATGIKEINARSVTIEAQTSIVLKVGSSFVEISPMGVTIEGAMVRINSGGAASGTTGIDYYDPEYAAECDTGEPGWLDRPRPPGSGWWGRGHHHDGGYHSRPVTYNPGTNTFNYGGSGIAVTGSPEFANQTLKTLASLDATPTGHQLVDNLQSNGHTATIREATPAEAAASGGGVATGVQPAMSNGTGSDTTVAWAPGTNAQYTDENGVAHTQPDEALLGHELIHADHNGRGTSLNGVPDPADPTGNQEESRTIGINDHSAEPVSENNILNDLGEDWRRTDHDSNAHTAP